MARKRHPAEKLFIKLMKKFTPDQLTEAIENRVDIARRLREEAEADEELREQLQFFREMAREYMRANPDYRARMREEGDDKVVEAMIKALAKESPERAERITIGPPVMDAASMGLVGGSSPALGPFDVADAEEEVKYPEAGVEFMKRNYVGIRRLLLGW